MTKDDIIKLAREAGLPMAWISDTGVLNWTDLEAFANLVAAAEREACAKGKRGSIALARSLCYEIAGATSEDDMDGGEYGSVDIAEILSAEVVRLQAALAQPEQQAEPSQWRDMVVVSLVREGINKHKARELADHFAVQQRAEPVQERITRIAWDERGVRTVNGIPDDAPQRPWLGLTDDEITELDMEISGRTMDECVRAIETKLKAKNDH